MSEEIRELAAQLADPRKGEVRLRQGTIQVYFYPDSCTITLAGSSVWVDSVKFLDSYYPRVGETVWVLQNGPDLLVLGAVFNPGETRWSPWTVVASGAGTITQVNSFWKRDGDMIEAQLHCTSSTFTTNPAVFNLPADAYAADMYVGNAMINLVGGGVWNQSGLYANSVSTFLIYPNANSSALGSAYGAVGCNYYGFLRYRAVQGA